MLQHAPSLALLPPGILMHIADFCHSQRHLGRLHATCRAIRQSTQQAVAVRGVCFRIAVRCAQGQPLERSSESAYTVFRSWRHEDQYQSIMAGVSDDVLRISRTTVRDRAAVARNIVFHPRDAASGTLFVQNCPLLWARYYGTALDTLVDELLAPGFPTSSTDVLWRHAPDAAPPVSPAQSLPQALANRDAATRLCAALPPRHVGPLAAASRATRDALRWLTDPLGACFRLTASLLPPGIALETAEFEGRPLYRSPASMLSKPGLDFEGQVRTGYVATDGVRVFIVHTHTLPRPPTQLAPQWHVVTLTVTPTRGTAGTYELITPEGGVQRADYTDEPPAVAVARARLLTLC